MALSKTAKNFIQNISKSKLSIYDAVSTNNTRLWIPTSKLQEILEEKLVGISLSGLPLRTRSKFVKSKICEALGYSIPKSFIKTKPRFPCQNFDTYIQKSNNLQIWNEDLSPDRRYVVMQVSQSGRITKVRVVAGEILIDLDTTGTLTQKYQARLKPTKNICELISKSDTDRIQRQFKTADKIKELNCSPIDFPCKGNFYGISVIFDILSRLVGHSFVDSGSDQERRRGQLLHKKICKCLGYKKYADCGKFPDIINQLLEVKLQTSPTIDLGLVCPNSTKKLSSLTNKSLTVRHCDIRYALFFGEIKDNKVTLTNFYLTTGKDFFSRFQQFKGKVVNKKIQMPLPKEFFND